MSCLFQNNPDLSLTYVTLKTDVDLCGYGLTYIAGRGNQIGKCENYLSHSYYKELAMVASVSINVI